MNSGVKKPSASPPGEGLKRRPPASAAHTATCNPIQTSALEVGYEFQNTKSTDGKMTLLVIHLYTYQTIST